jgi:hypothetical protein
MPTTTSARDLRRAPDRLAPEARSGAVVAWVDVAAHRPLALAGDACCCLRPWRDAAR